MDRERAQGPAGTSDEIADDYAGNFGWWRFNLDAGTVSASRITRVIYGLSSDLMPIAFAKTIPLPEYRERLDRAMRELIDDGRPYDVEFEIRRPTDGAVRLIRSVAEFDAERNVVIGTVEDMTDRRKAEEAIRVERQRLAFVIEGSRLGTWEWNVQTNAAVFNETWAAMLGYTLEELEPLSYGTWESLTHPDDLTVAREQLARCISGAWKDYSCELRMKHKGGHWVWVLTRGRIMSWDEEGRPLMMFGAHDDITERKLAAQEAAESHALLENLAGLVPGVIYQYQLFPDGHSAFPYSSAGMADIYEVTPEDVHKDATPVFNRLHPDDHDRVAEEIFESARELRNFYSEYRVILPRQGLRWRLCEAKPQRMPDGSTLWHGIITDITDRKEAEAERDQLQEQLTRSQRLESVGRLAGGVAHDFNNMLNVIMGHADLILEDLPAGSPLREDVLEIHKATERSADLTRQLLAFARKQTVVPKVLDLNQTIASMFKMLKRLIGEDIALSWNPGGNLAPVRLDPAQIDQMLANLVVNARDAVEPGQGKVTIGTGMAHLDAATMANQEGVDPGDFVVLTVSDNGCGMDAATRARIFEPFFTTKGVGEGTGLGLATIYGIVKQNRGMIQVESAPGAGAAFRVYLPAWESPEEAEPGIAADLVPVARGRETILLVEDEKAILALGTRILERLGYQVIPASSPREAIRSVASHGAQIDLLIADVVMPEMNGRELADHMDGLYPGIKRLFISGYTADIIANRGVVHEGVDLLVKPYSNQEFGRRVREILDS